MRRFVRSTLLFLLPLLVLLVAAEAYMRSLPNTYRYKDEWMWRNGDRVSTLLLGNSHGFFGLVPSEMGDSVFNLCAVSQRAREDFFLLQRYASACPHLHTVILVVDNSNLFDVPMADEEPFRLTYYQLYMGDRSHSWLSRYGFEIASMQACWEKLKQCHEQGGVGCDSLGWGTAYTYASRNQATLKAGNVNPHSFNSWEATLANARDVRAIAKWCQQRHVRLVLLQMPVCKAYAAKMPDFQRRYINALADSCRQEYGALTADFSRDPRLTENDFFDADHLNDVGARRFSRLLAEWYKAQTDSLETNTIKK